jgi:hypothetical protein
MLGLVAFANGAWADALPEAPPVNPYVDTDGDGIPLAVLHPPPVKLSPAQTSAAQKAQAKADADKNWLVTGYEKQLKANAANDPTQEGGANLYQQLSQNKELAKLAGITPADSDDDDTSPEQKAANQATANAALNSTASGPQQSDSHAATSAPTSHFSSVFDMKPLITPLSAPDAAGLHNFYASLPVVTAPTSAPGLAEDPADLETPGMTASKSTPGSSLESPDLTLDVLPGESIEQAKADRAANNAFDVPQPMTADQLHSTLPSATSLQALPVLPGPSGRTSSNSAATLPKVPKLPQPDENASSIRQQNIVMPVHAPIADPYDILNH